MSEKPFDNARNTIMFLRMAVSQLRGMLNADHVPDAASTSFATKPSGGLG
jgi:hypothetical protein